MLSVVVWVVVVCVGRAEGGGGGGGGGAIHPCKLIAVILSVSIKPRLQFSFFFPYGKGVADKIPAVCYPVPGNLANTVKKASLELNILTTKILVHPFYLQIYIF